MNAPNSLHVAVVAGALIVACGADARNLGHMVPVATSLSAARVAGDIADIEFGFGSASAQGAEIVGGAISVQGVATHLAEPHGFKPTDDEACDNALRDALKRLSEAARKAGGHAVVGIVSSYNGTTIDDPVQVECRLGSAKVLVPLSGVIARSLPAPAAAAK